MRRKHDRASEYAGHPEDFERAYGPHARAQVFGREGDVDEGYDPESDSIDGGGGELEDDTDPDSGDGDFYEDDTDPDSGDFDPEDDSVDGGGSVHRIVEVSSDRFEITGTDKWFSTRARAQGWIDKQG